jgi:uncharacterized protein YaaW (UPF0174 family)
LKEGDLNDQGEDKDRCKLLRQRNLQYMHTYIQLQQRIIAVEELEAFPSPSRTDSISPHTRPYRETSIRMKRKLTTKYQEESMSIPHIQHQQS